MFNIVGLLECTILKHNNQIFLTQKITICKAWIFDKHVSNFLPEVILKNGKKREDELPLYIPLYIRSTTGRKEQR